MAAAGESGLVSINERSFIENALAKGLRVDGRKPMKMRNIKIIFGRKAGLVNVKFGRTHVLAATCADVVKPYPERPSEGMIRFHVDFSPMASPFYEAGRPTRESAQVARSIERGIRDSNAIDTESLCILSGSKVWEVRCDVRILDDDGNAGDCANLAAIASLKHFRRPDVTVVGDRVVIHSVEDRQPVPIALHHIPMRISFVFFKNDASLAAIDPSLKESLVSTAEISYTVNKHKEICGISKLGGTTLPLTHVSSDFLTLSGSPKGLYFVSDSKVCKCGCIGVPKTDRNVRNIIKRGRKIATVAKESVYTNPIEAFVDDIAKMQDPVKSLESKQKAGDIKS